jgi:hypothetical protein
MEGGKLIIILKTIVNMSIFRYGKIKNSSLKLLLLMLFYMNLKFGDAIYLESHATI